MKIPKYIKDAILKSAHYYEIAGKENLKIRNWLEKNNCLNDYFLDQLLDSTEFNNEPESFISFLENEDDNYCKNASNYI